MAEDNNDADFVDIIEKFCNHLEFKLERDRELSDEDKTVLREEIGSFRGISNELNKFLSDFPILSKTFISAAKTLHEHEQKLELLKDCLVTNGLMIQVEATSEEEAVAMAKQTLEDEMIADMLAKVDKTTVH